MVLDTAAQIETRIDAAGLLVDMGRLDEAARALAGLLQEARRPGDLSRAARRTLARSIHMLGRLRAMQRCLPQWSRSGDSASQM